MESLGAPRGMQSVELHAMLHINDIMGTSLPLGGKQWGPHCTDQGTEKISGLSKITQLAAWILNVILKSLLLPATLFSVVTGCH